MCKEQKSKLESNDTVSKAVFDQIKWERDVALRTLEEHGIGFAERATCSKMETVDTDLISRLAAIDAICSVCGMQSDYHKCDWRPGNSKYQFCKEINSLCSLPSAQPEKRTAKRTETHGVCSDCISRQAAIDAVEKAVFKGVAKSAIESLPPVEPERPKRTETMMVDGEPTEIDPLSYEVGCSHSQTERPKGEWIPVSERLPKKEKKRYWVCTDTEYQCECRWTNNRFGIGVAEWGWSIFDTPQYTKPIAWMPLPEPYREKSEVEE